MKREPARQPRRFSKPAIGFIGARRWGVATRALALAVREALAAEAPHVRGDVTVVLTSDRDVRALNARYRGLDRPTDVLSFEIGDGRRAGEPFGDIVVSVETARRQARSQGVALDTELRRLIVHGALHLSGHDHHERAQAARMAAAARAVLARVERSSASDGASRARSAR
ncbi:MAG TPA: rRNA maturation RNase YbeY [Candidatus Eremiobacteraceae bacterium]|nr:rRNA maturation RNase YbeY [Candidatus Eremiobacteraceae bacterium]